uniref:DUF3240 family protein n=1 Tax=Ningiella ruwaisensis TaxID=2364274 RepID=UPI00109F71B1|nr:DUF3240 family protein [Ningiella ruwaisensis]
MQTDKHDVFLVMIVPKVYKDDLVDVLLSLEMVGGFHLFPIQGFSHEHAYYNLQEQVTGYQTFYRFELAHSKINSDILVSRLKEQIAGKSIRFWLLPLLGGGHF